MTAATENPDETLGVPGLVLIDHTLEVPLDHDRPGGETITLHAREVATPGGRERPFLVYLQGGPGHEAPRPSGPGSPPWLARALEDYRVLMLDQRGTGLSTPFGGAADRARPAEEAARYLTHFRADAIVRDAELLRRHLGVETWSLLGQSFGGFTTLAYLTRAPESVAEAFFTGGLPAVGHDIDEVYSATYRTMQRKCEQFYARFPGDRKRMLAALDACDAGEVILPDGTSATSRLLRTAGHRLGTGDGATSLHFLLERDPRSSAFAHDLYASRSFDGRNPLYAVVHESCCADGGVTGWSAQRVLPATYEEDPTLLFGEHVFDWLFTDCADLAPYAGAAEILARHEWPRLYDADVLRSVDVPCAAVVYGEDAYVERAFSEETAALLPRMRAWVTTEYEHNGLRDDGGRILDRLIGLARGRIAR